MAQFDWIVVGAGSAGSVLASRLSQDASTSVVLVEAGPDHTSSATPGGVRGLNFSAPFDVPDRIWPDLVAVRAAGQEPLRYLRGRGAGGSSSINALIAMRGTPDDYNHWVRAYGCRGWGWDDMRMAFITLEDDAEFGDGIDHGSGGPLPVTRKPGSARAPLDRAIAAAVTDLGYPTCDDYHAPGATGLSRLAFNVRDSCRCSVNDAYLEPARVRPNLTVRGSTLIDRVLLEDRRALGVITADGEEITAKEVLVAAGAVHSPTILLRSGIGPESGRPVGANLIDHPLIPIVLALDETAHPPSANAPMASHVLRYTSNLGDGGDNDMQIGWLSPIAAVPQALGVGMIFASVTHVHSRGNLRLRSNDPLVDPSLKFRMLSDERDLMRLRDGLRRAVNIADHPAVNAIAAYATPDHVVLDTDDATDAWMIANVTDYKHPVGTCRMGAANDPDAVVDPQCRVIGYEQLRVCDASVMPDVPRANTHLTTVAIAERIAAQLGT